MTNLQKNILMRTAPKTYFEWYEKWYYILYSVSFIMLTISAIASYNFWLALTTYKYIAIFATCSISLLLGWLIDHVLNYWHQFGKYDWLAYLFIAVLIGNGLADYVGSPEVAHEIIKEYQDTKSPLLNKQIEEIEGKQKAILSTYSWKGKTPSKLPLKSKWHDVKADKKQMNNLEAQKAALISQLTTQSDINNRENSEYESRLSNTKFTFKGISIIASILFVLLQMWVFDFEYKVRKQAGKTEVKRVESTQSDLSSTQPVKSETVSNEADLAFNQLLQENEALREEIQARKENEARQNKTDNDFFQTEPVETVGAGETVVFDKQGNIEGYRRNCPNCGTENIKKSSHGKYCDDHCKNQYHSRMKKQKAKKVVMWS